VGLLLAVASPEISRYLNLPITVFLRVLAVGAVFYILLGVRRGLLQGSCDFRVLALNLALEVVIKLLGAMVKMSAGFGVTGVVGAMTASLVAGYVVAAPARYTLIVQTKVQPVLQTGVDEGIQAIIFFIG